ncbi:hypothetical protein LTR53_003526 [Teratosphaeriaceae sp. CCFEE 6253]|nr:hypothetical protein LTR53_003526 [Teratosphaeriaceae sp. CCFEE 6253]
MVERSPRKPKAHEISLDHVTADILETLSRQLVHLVQTGQLHDPATTQYISPDLVSNWHLNPPSIGLTAFLAVNAQISWSSIEGAAESTKATVWVTMGYSKVPAPFHETVQHETVCKLDWQLEHRGWNIVRQSSIRGPALTGIY